MNAYQKAIKENGFAVVDGVKYAVGQQPYLDNYSEGVAYQAYGFSEKMTDEGGEHDPLFDESVQLIWDCTEWHQNDSEEEFDCDWENEAFVK